VTILPIEVIAPSTANFPSFLLLSFFPPFFRKRTAECPWLWCFSNLVRHVIMVGTTRSVTFVSCITATFMNCWRYPGSYSRDHPATSLRPAAHQRGQCCTLLYCVVLYSTVLYCTVLYCTWCTFCYATFMNCWNYPGSYSRPSASKCSTSRTSTGSVLYCTVLYCTVLYCTVLYCTVLCCQQLSSYY